MLDDLLGESRTELKKAVIESEGGEEITVLFNPTQYNLDKSNQFAEVGVPGLASPILQYVRGNSRTLTMDLFFDTYEAGTDVSQQTGPIYDLLGIRGDRHVPPICTVRWGTFEFRGVLERVGGKFTLFDSEGIPVRAILSVSFKEALEVDLQVKDPPRESVDQFKTYLVKRGDTLASIAAAEYEDPARWRVIAEANGIVNPRILPPGRVLVLPPLT